MLDVLADPVTWVALFKIAVINVVLSGDNAVVIALACRSLPPREQKRAFIVGTAGIVVLMTLLTSCAALLMTLPYIQIIGCVLLLWIGIKLLLLVAESFELRIRRIGRQIVERVGLNVLGLGLVQRIRILAAACAESQRGGSNEEKTKLLHQLTPRYKLYRATHSNRANAMQTCP